MKPPTNRPYVINPKNAFSFMALFLYAALGYASVSPYIRWIEGEYPMPKINGQKDIPLHVHGHTASLLIVPDRTYSSYAGNLIIKKGASEIRVEDHGWIRSIGIVNLNDSDSLIVHFYTPINKGARDEYLVWVDPATEDSIWKRYENRWRKDDPKVSVSDNFSFTKFAAGRKILDDLAKERFIEK